MLSRSLLCCLALSGALAGPALAANTDPAAAARYYEAGLARYQNNDIRGAIVELKNALQQDNQMLAAHLLIAKALLQDKQYAAADAAFRAALRLGVDIGEIAVPLGRLYLALGRTRDILDRLPETGLRQGVQAEVLAIRGEAYAKQGRVEDALRSTQRGRMLDPSAPAPLVAEVTIQLNAGHLVEAREAARRAVEVAPSSASAWNAAASVAHAGGALDQASQNYARALELDPNFIDARVARAAVALDLNRLDEARRELDQLKVKAPEDPRADYLRAVIASMDGDGKAANVFLEQVHKTVDQMPREWLVNNEQFLMLGALAHHGLKNRQKASEYLEILAKHYPRNAGARRLLAANQLESGDSAGAVTTIEPLLDPRLKDANAMFIAGRAYLQRKQFDKAQVFLQRAADLGGGGAEVLTALGQSQVVRGDPAQGIKTLERSLSTDGKNEAVVLMLAGLHLRHGNEKRARALAQELVVKNPADVVALNMLGVIKQAMGDRAGARSDYESALRHQPGFLPARLNVLRLEAAEGRTAEARNALRGLLKAEPNTPAAWYELGLLEQGQRRYGDARDAFRSALEKSPNEVRFALALIEVSVQLNDSVGALQYAKDAAIQHPSDLRVLETLAATHLAQGDRQRALLTYREMAKLAEYETPAQVRIGHLNLQAGNIEGAMYNLDKAKAGQPQLSAVILLEGRIALANGQPEVAARLAQQLRVKPDGAVAGLLLAADAAMAARRPGEAQALGAEALRLAPSSDNAQALARLYLQDNDPGGAIKVLEAWLKGTPGDAASRQALVELHMRARQWQAARAHAQKWVGGAPEDARAHNNLALILLEQGDASGALASAERARGLDPEGAGVMDTYGWVLFRQGRTDDGLRFLRDARLKSPDNPEHRYHLASALAASGRGADAREELRPLLAGEAGGEWRERAEKLVSGSRP